MVPARSNFDLADHTIAHLLRSVPTVFGLRAFMEQVLHSMLEERVRKAMWYAFLSPTFFISSGGGD